MREEIADKLIRIGFATQMTTIFSTMILSAAILVYVALLSLGFAAGAPLGRTILPGLIVAAAILVTFVVGYITEHIGRRLKQVRVVSRETSD